MKDNTLYYSVGPLLYCPANKKTIAQALISNKFGSSYSLALCLEDTINDNFVKKAEEQLLHSLRTLYEASEKNQLSLPYIFIRVRDYQQIERLFKNLGICSELIKGIIIPKFSLDNADLYIDSLDKLNNSLSTNMYMMPIYESSSIIDKRYRYNNLYQLKDKLDAIEDLVLNIRVGGNDLCHLFGFRRNVNESIHSIKPISDIFSDIVTVYGQNYVISGPVWEYYSGEDWENGLISEIKDDILCGFIGKTVIHPNQIPVVNNAFKVTRQNYNDAQNILNWDVNNSDFVLGNSSRERMNEYKTHLNWAKKTSFLAEHYGII